MVQRRSQRRAAASWHVGGDLVWCGKPQDLRLLDGAVELVLGQAGGQIVDRPCGGGERQAVMNGGIDGAGSMDAQARARSLVAAAHAHVHITIVGTDAPHGGRRVMAQHPAGRQHRCHLQPARRADRPHLVHAAEHRHQPAAPHAVRDRRPREPRLEQLRDGHDPVLAPRERDDSRIPNVHFPPLTAPAPVSGDFVAHSPRFAPLTTRPAVNGGECTLSHPHQSPSAPDPSPSMPPLSQRRHTTATCEPPRSSARFAPGLLTRR
jgi:hypothetical protein